LLPHLAGAASSCRDGRLPSLRVRGGAVFPIRPEVHSFAQTRACTKEGAHTKKTDPQIRCLGATPVRIMQYPDTPLRGGGGVAGPFGRHSPFPGGQPTPKGPADLRPLRSWRTGLLDRSLASRRRVKGDERQRTGNARRSPPGSAAVTSHTRITTTHSSLGAAGCPRRGEPPNTAQRVLHCRTCAARPS
jgi:hypothetical protein